MPKLDHPVPRTMSFHGAQRCNVSIDTDSDSIEVPFEAVPRIGESVSMPVSGDPKVFRVTRVQHNAGDLAAPNRASVDIEVTSNIL